jgi:hypothetical protein
MPKGDHNLPAFLHSGWMDWAIVLHSLRTAVAAVVSVAVARLARLPEAYWAPVTTLVIAQSSLGAALAVFPPAFRGHRARCGRLRSRSHLLWPSRSRIRRMRLFSGISLRLGASRSKRISLRWGDVGDRSPDTEGSACLEDRVSSLCRGGHRNCSGSPFGNAVAGERKRRLGESMNFF